VTEAEQEPIPETASPGRSRLTAALLGLATLFTGVSTFFLIAVAGAVHAPGAGQGYALAAVAGVLGITLLLPAGLGGYGLATLRRRGIKIRVVRTVAGLTLLWNGVILAVGASVDKPWSALDLAWNHARWVPLAVLDRVPADPSTLSNVALVVAQVNRAESSRDLAPLLTQESAAGLAVKWLRLRDEQLSDARVDPMYTMLGVDRVALMDSPKAFEDTLVPQGHVLLHEVAEIVDLEADSRFRWRDAALAAAPLDEVAATYEVTSVDTAQVEVRVDSDTVLEAVFENGSWRLDLASFADWVGEDRLEKTDEAGELPGPVIEDIPEEPASHVDVRRAFRQAAAGVAGHRAGTTAFDAGWPDSLTHESAASTALGVLSWCANSGEVPVQEGEDVPVSQEPAHEDDAQDPLFARDLAALRADYGLTENDAELTEALRDALVPRGDELLRRALEICAPVKRRRQAQQQRNGLLASDAHRMRWAELEAQSLSEAAVITDVGVGEKTVAIGGVNHIARLEDGVWRMDWR
jgi:hypothetical protein